MKILFLMMVLGVSSHAATSFQVTTYSVEMNAASESAKDCLSVGCRRDICAKATEKLVKKIEKDCLAIGGKIVLNGNLGFSNIALLDGHFSCQVTNKNRPDVLVCEL